MLNIKAVAKLKRAGIKVTDGKIAKADLEKAMKILVVADNIETTLEELMKSKNADEVQDAIDEYDFRCIFVGSYGDGNEFVTDHQGFEAGIEFEREVGIDNCYAAYYPRENAEQIVYVLKSKATEFIKKLEELTEKDSSDEEESED